MRKYSSILIGLLIIIGASCKKDEIQVNKVILTYNQDLIGTWIPVEHKLNYFSIQDLKGSDTTVIITADSILKFNSVYYNNSYYKLANMVATSFKEGYVILDTLKLNADTTFSFSALPLTPANTKWYVKKNDGSEDTSLGQLSFGILTPATGYWSYNKMYNIKELEGTKMVIEISGVAKETVFVKINYKGIPSTSTRFVRHLITYKKL